jgi:hypothetical protein
MEVSDSKGRQYKKSGGRKIVMHRKEMFLIIKGDSERHKMERKFSCT